MTSNIKLAKRKQEKCVWVRVSPEVDNFFKDVAKKNGISKKKVIELILECELDIVEYAVFSRRRFARRLGLLPTKKFLYRNLI